ncbi:hypothetical protein [Microbacterium aurantiacum]|uniref:hypothetical protein n=1 Tax=Microbacterium aurantiacum TaxID=162393 RepID=UPI0015E1418A|nr:hypothetical protein [Microbacterium aurantiacum]
MTERDLFFIVMIAISASALTVFIVQFVRSRRRRDDDGRSGNWWEGPWDEDKR